MKRNEFGGYCIFAVGMILTLGAGGSYVMTWLGGFDVAIGISLVFIVRESRKEE